MATVQMENLERLTSASPQFGGLTPALFCSWGIWVEKDERGEWFIPQNFDRGSTLSFPEISEELAAVLHTDAIFLGFNPGVSALTRRPGQDDWLPFHAPGGSRNDRIAEALRDTKLWGAFMTDLLPLIHRNKAELVSGWLKNRANLPEIRENFRALEWLLEEVGAVGADGAGTPPLLCFGADTHRYATLFMSGENRLTRRNYTPIKLDHFSGANRKLNTVTYRALLRSTLEPTHPELITW